MKAHKVEPKLQVGDRVSALNTLTRKRIGGIIISHGYSGGELWWKVEFDDGVTMWINAEQLEKEDGE